MNISLLNIMHTKVWDFRQDMAQSYADALRNAIELHIPNDIEKKEGFFLSKKGFQKDGKTIAADFEDKLFVGDIHRIESHLYWNDEELQEDDQIINVVVVDGPVTRDGDGCSYGTKDFRDQVMYANTIPQVVGHLFVINTPGGQASCRNDYEMMFNDCREKGKPTVAFVDGMCCSSGVNLACRCDRTIVMNPKDEFGCIGTMAAFWATAHDTVDRDGSRYVELVGKDCPEKNAWYRDAAKGEYEKLQAELDKSTEEFHDEVRQNRPQVTDDMLTGKVFEAQEVMPQLVDEIGDMERAIECVFELADEKLVAARLVMPESPESPESPDGREQESTHQISNDMTDQELKAQEAAAAQAAEQEPAEVPAQEPAAEPAEEPVEEPAAEEGAQEPAEEPAAEPAEESAEEPAAEPSGEGAQEPAAEPAEEPAEEPVAEPEGEGAEEPAEEPVAEPAEEYTVTATSASAGNTATITDVTTYTGQESAQEPASEETIEDTQEEIDRIADTLHNAEQEIAGLKESLESQKNAAGQLQSDIDQARKDLDAANAAIAEKDKSIEEKDALIEQLKKQVGDLKAEVKELAGKPAPMTTEESGIPADNSTGDAPKVRQKRITRDMSYEQIRAAKKKAAEEVNEGK